MNIAAELCEEVRSHEGRTDGMGYHVDHVRSGRGYSSVEYAHKEFPNGRWLHRKTKYPGVFDGLAGYPTDIREVFQVWLGWEEFDGSVEGEENPIPPGDLNLPPNSTGWLITAYDGPIHWWANFDDQDLAEDFCAGLPPICAIDELPLIRNKDWQP
jgi:hypothetical protein